MLAEASKELLCEYVHLKNEAHVQAAKFVSMHIVDCREAQEADTVLARHSQDSPFQRRDALLKKYLGISTDTKEGCALFCMCHSLVLNKGLLYVSMTPKGEAEVILAFVVPTGQCCTALNGVHHNAGHQGQQRTLAPMQEQFWWPMMMDDCQALVWGCQ